MNSEKRKWNAKKYRINRIRPFDVIVLIFFILLVISCLYPLINSLLVSFASEGDYYRSTLIVIPYHFNFKSYDFIFTQGRIFQAFFESLWISILYVLISIVMTSLGAYALSKTKMPGNKIFFVFIMITMFFGGGLIPFFLVIRSLGLINSYFAIIFPFCINTFYMIILRNFFRQVPESISESCRVDGASEFTIFAKFVVPLSIVGIITICIFYFVDKWNDWYWPMMLINSQSKYPLALEIRNMISGNAAVDYSGIDLTYQKGKEAAMIVFSIIPVLVIVPFCQKFMTRGVLIGSVKS